MTWREFVNSSWYDSNNREYDIIIRVSPGVGEDAVYICGMIQFFGPDDLIVVGTSLTCDGPIGID